MEFSGLEEKYGEKILKPAPTHYEYLFEAFVEEVIICKLTTLTNILGWSKSFHPEMYILTHHTFLSPNLKHWITSQAYLVINMSSK